MEPQKLREELLKIADERIHDAAQAHDEHMDLMCENGVAIRKLKELEEEIRKFATRCVAPVVPKGRRGAFESCWLTQPQHPEETLPETVTKVGTRFLEEYSEQIKVLRDEISRLGLERNTLNSDVNRSHNRIACLMWQRDRFTREFPLLIDGARRRGCKKDVCGALNRCVERREMPELGTLISIMKLPLDPAVMTHVCENFFHVTKEMQVSAEKVLAQHCKNRILADKSIDAINSIFKLEPLVKPVRAASAPSRGSDSEGED